MQRVSDIVFTAEGFVGKDDGVDIFFLDQNPPKAKAIHGIVAIFRVRRFVGVASAGIVKIEVVLVRHVFRQPTAFTFVIEQIEPFGA